MAWAATFHPYLRDRPTFDVANRFGTASAGQAVPVAHIQVFFARPEQWHIEDEFRQFCFPLAWPFACTLESVSPRW